MKTRLVLSPANPVKQAIVFTFLNLLGPYSWQSCPSPLQKQSSLLSPCSGSTLGGAPTSASTSLDNCILSFLFLQLAPFHWDGHIATQVVCSSSTSSDCSSKSRARLLNTRTHRGKLFQTCE